MIVSLFLMFFLYALLAFGVMQVLNVLYLKNPSNLMPYLDYNVFQYDDVTKRMHLIIIVVCVAIFICMLASSVKGKNIKELFRSKYDKENYSKFMTKWQRRRGLITLHYDCKGQLTNNRIECLWERIKSPITITQNKICSFYNRPETRKWNLPSKVKSGMPMMAYRSLYFLGRYNKVRYLPFRGHVMFMGMTGRGKSMSFVLNIIHSIMDANETMILHDPKGELCNSTKKDLEDRGYKVIILNFTAPQRGDAWNPLKYPYDRWKEIIKESVASDFRDVNLSEAVEQFIDIGLQMTYEPNAKDPLWSQTAAEMISGAAQFLAEEGIDKYVNFKSVRMLFKNDNEVESAAETALAKYIKKYRKSDDGSAVRLSGFLESGGNTKRSFQSVFNNKMNLVTATEDIIEMLSSPSAIDIRKIFAQKTAVFLITHDEKTTYHPLVTIFFKQLYEAAVREARTSVGGKLKTPIKYVWEEMALMPAVKDINAMYGAARSRGITMLGFVQSNIQLVERYGKETAKNMIENCSDVIYLGSGDIDAQEFFKKRCGSTKIWNKNKKQYEYRDLITEAHLNKFQKGKSLLTSVEWNPYIIHLPMYTKYIFYKKSNEEDINQTKKRESSKIEYFNVSQELEKRIHNKIQSTGAKKYKKKLHSFDKETGEILENS